MNNVRVKIITLERDGHLADIVNDFLSSNFIDEVVDIKYTTTYQPKDETTLFSAMIIYKEKKL